MLVTEINQNVTNQSLLSLQIICLVAWWLKEGFRWKVPKVALVIKMGKAVFLVKKLRKMLTLIMVLVWLPKLWIRVSREPCYRAQLFSTARDNKMIHLKSKRKNLKAWKERHHWRKNSQIQRTKKTLMWSSSISRWQERTRRWSRSLFTNTLLIWEGKKKSPATGSSRASTLIGCLTQREVRLRT